MMVHEITTTQSAVCQLVSAVLFQTKEHFEENTD